jgi:hypothetical protein
MYGLLIYKFGHFHDILFKEIVIRRRTSNSQRLTKSGIYLSEIL